MKKKIITGIFVFLFLGSGVQVFASNVLDTNLLSLIKNKIVTYIDSSNEDVNNYIDKKEAQQKTDLGEFVEKKNTDLEKNINNVKEDGIADMDSELDAYLIQLKAELDALYAQEEENAINELNDKFLSETIRIKEQLLKELEAIYSE